MYAGTAADFEREYGAQSQFGSRLKFSEIMEGIPENFSKAKKTAHNEVTRWYDSGLIIVRYRKTDILAFLPDRYLWKNIYKPDGRIIVNNGGYPTVSTRRHMTVALRANGRHHVGVYQSKGEQHVNNTTFDQCALVHANGQVIADTSDDRWQVYSAIAELPIHNQG